MTEPKHMPIGRGAVAVLAIVVAVVSTFSRYGGYLCMFLTIVVGGVLAYEQWKLRRSWGSVAALLLAIAVIVAAGEFGLSLNAAATEIQEREDEARRHAAQHAAQERASKDQAVREREQQRGDLLRAELQRPLAERAAEAEWRMGNLPEITAKAHAVCYADFLLQGAEETPEIKSLRKTREKVAKAIKAQYKADLKRRRVLICHDGERSGCECRGSHQGCCSGHGGVARCEPISEVELVCDPRDVDDIVEFHLKAVGRPLPGGKYDHDRGRDPARWYMSPLRSVD
jgi:hypothetical protein